MACIRAGAHRSVGRVGASTVGEDPMMLPTKLLDSGLMKITSSKIALGVTASYDAILFIADMIPGEFR